MERKPLVIIGGTVHELPDGDSTGSALPSLDTLPLASDILPDKIIVRQASLYAGAGYVEGGYVEGGYVEDGSESQWAQATWAQLLDWLNIATTTSYVGAGYVESGYIE